MFNIGALLVNSYFLAWALIIVLLGLSGKHTKIMATVFWYKFRKGNPVVIHMQLKDGGSNVYCKNRNQESFDINGGRYNFPQLPFFYKNSRLFRCPEAFYDEGVAEPKDPELDKRYQTVKVVKKQIFDAEGNPVLDLANNPTFEEVKEIPILLDRIDPLTYDFVFIKAKETGKMEGQRNEKILFAMTGLCLLATVAVGILVWNMSRANGDIINTVHSISGVVSDIQAHMVTKV